MVNTPVAEVEDGVRVRVSVLPADTLRLHLMIMTTPSLLVIVRRIRRSTRRTPRHLGSLTRRRHRRPPAPPATGTTTTTAPARSR